MKLTARRIVLLILSIIVMGFGLYSVIGVVVGIPALREESLKILSDPQFGEFIEEPEKLVNIVVGIAVAFSCVGGAYYLLTGLFGLFFSLGKYRGGAHVVLTWIYLVLCGIGLVLNIIGLIGGARFDFSIVLNIIEIAVAITFIVICKQLKEGYN